jgi:hypothetical protein
MPYFSWVLGIFAVGVFIIIVLISKLLAKNKPFAQLITIKTVVLTAVITPVVYSVFYVAVVFFKINQAGTDRFSTNPFSLNTYVLTRRTDVYQDLQTKPYVGVKILTMQLLPGDTVTTAASYQKGSVLNGIGYGRIQKNGHTYWFVTDRQPTLFNYTYRHQPLTFTATDAQNLLYWRRAQQYMTNYRTFHGTDVTETQDQDTVLYARCEFNYGAKWLKISRKKLPAGWRLEVSASTFKGSEDCIIANVKDRFGNKPTNHSACAYFIVHGDFFQDTLPK